MASSSTRCELSLFFSIARIADGVPTVTLHRRAEQRRQLVDHRQVARIGDDDDQRLAVAAARDEAVAQHQVGGDGAEQLAVDVELVHVDELEPIALRQAAGFGRFRGVIDRADRGSCDQRLGGALGFRSAFHQCTTDDSWKSGR